MSEEIRVPNSGSRILSVIPLTKDESTGKYKLPTTPVRYLFNNLIKESGWEKDKPSESTSSDSYLSWEDTQGQTLQIRRNPVTKTYNSTSQAFEAESSSGTKVYPAFVVLAGNTPAMKSGTTTTQLSINALYKKLLDWQDEVCLIGYDLGAYYYSSEAAETGWQLASINTKIESKNYNSDFKGYSFTFGGMAKELDATTFTSDALTALGESITPLGSSTAIALKALATSDLSGLASGELIFKTNS